MAPIAHRFTALPLALVAAATLAAPARATVTLNDGNALFSNTVPTSPTSTAGGSGNFQPEGASTTDSLFRFMWHWRINGVDTRESVFSSSTAGGVGFAEAGSGTDTGTQSWTGLDAGRFNAVLTSVLVDGGIAGQAVLYQTMAITNISAGPLDMALFNYADYDINGAASASNDLAALFASDTIQISEGANFVQHQGVGADAYAVTPFSPTATSVAGLLTNSAINDLANTGLAFGPGDYTGAWQWNRVIGIGQTVSISAAHAINQAVPAPGALALIGLAGLRARRRRPS